MSPSFRCLILLSSFLLVATVLDLRPASSQTDAILLEDLLAEDLDPSLLEGSVGESGGGFGLAEEWENEEGEERRSLFWRAMRYYISYGALAANRVPCPPRSGRSYYTHNCFKERGPVHPYYRPCSIITRCRR
ncbi:hypothetical protein MLD38_028576 [Melastoma candidum]|uniref:Uncharacterized protein n=1 Tax=Melastoma candidum TaxID=119954 RepID=A0ACB9N205_9MYRT|nr:hypothetical protein MLD38_028576 [Melastoma candidum]